MGGVPGAGQQVEGLGRAGSESGGNEGTVYFFDLPVVNQALEQVDGGFVSGVRDRERPSSHSAVQQGRAIQKIKSAPTKGGEEIEMGLGIGVEAGHVKGQGGGKFAAVMQPKTGGAASRQQGGFRRAKLRRSNQHVNVVGGERRQALVIAEDQETDAGLLPGAEDGGH